MPLASALVGLVLVASGVKAQPSPAEDAISTADRARAEMLFEEGRRLRDAGRCDQAVDKLAASHQLAPAVGTLLNLGDCHEKLGQTASAWVHFREAVAVARRQQDEPRARYAGERAQALEAMLRRLVITAPDPQPDMAIMRNGQAVPAAELGVAVPVDPGEVEVVAEAPGFLPWRRRVTVEEPGDAISVVVPPLKVRPIEVPPEPSTGVPTQTLVGWSLMGLGGATVVAGAVVGIRASLLDGRSDDFCPPGDGAVCLPEAAELRDEARAHELASIVLLSAGAGLAGIGGVLWWTSPADDVAFVPWLGPQVAGLGVAGRW